MFTKLVAKCLEGNKDEWFLKSLVFKSYSLLIKATNIWK